jgi:hypothetical protein
VGKGKGVGVGLARAVEGKSVRNGDSLTLLYRYEEDVELLRGFGTPIRPTQQRDTPLLW